MKALVFSVLFALILSACGGSSGGSPTANQTASPAAIDATSVDLIATKASEAFEATVIQKIANEATPLAPSLPGGASITSQEHSFNQVIIGLAQSSINNDINLPAGIVLDSEGYFGPDYCGGEVSIDDQEYSDALTTGVLNASMLVTDLCINQVTFNGTIIFSQTGTTLTIQYSDISVSDGSTTQTLNMTLSCNTPSLSCTLVSDFIGSDNKVYKIADISISGSGDGPYNFSATLNLPDLGTVEVSTITPIMFGDCMNNHPISGALEFTGSNGSMGSITFNDCNNYSVDWNGVIEPPPAPAPVINSYSGSWL